ncbi:MAG: hypothetical protein Q9205_005713 [Flavoplaca limonia]
MVQLLYDGQTTDERLKAVTGICNLQWFTRVWTAMEYVRSSQVISMDGEGNMYSKGNDPLFMNKLFEVWFEEAQKHKSIHHLEARAEIGKNLVPWNLGPLLDMGKAKSSPPADDTSLETPLRLKTHLQQDGWEILQGLNDLGVWPLGAQKQMPTFHQDFLFENGNVQSGDPVLKLHRIGVVSQVHEYPQGESLLEFAHEASIVLDATGPDLNSFIESLGWRLYNETPNFIKQKLAAANQSDELARVLRERCNKELGATWSIEGPGGARWVAEAMTLSLTNPGGKRGEAVSQAIQARGLTVVTLINKAFSGMEESDEDRGGGAVERETKRMRDPEVWGRLDELYCTAK